MSVVEAVLFFAVKNIAVINIKSNFKFITSAIFLVIFLELIIEGDISVLLIYKDVILFIFHLVYLHSSQHNNVLHVDEFNAMAYMI